MRLCQLRSVLDAPGSSASGCPHRPSAWGCPPWNPGGRYEAAERAAAAGSPKTPSKRRLRTNRLRAFFPRRGMASDRVSRGGGSRGSLPTCYPQPRRRRVHLSCKWRQWIRPQTWRTWPSRSVRRRPRAPCDPLLDAENASLRGRRGHERGHRPASRLPGLSRVHLVGYSGCRHRRARRLSPGWYCKLEDGGRQSRHRGGERAPWGEPPDRVPEPHRRGRKAGRFAAASFRRSKRHRGTTLHCTIFPGTGGGCRRPRARHC